jgi:3',5'-cyclic AMP phosphodiesterase CpdA
MRIVHLSDVHIWRYAFNPAHLLNKRVLGLLQLVSGRARRFRLERIEDVVARVKSLEPDHILITGDLTTTALPSEFRAAKRALAHLLIDGARATVIPGNHDRYTKGSVRRRKFETTFGEFAPAETYPWLKPLAPDLAILGLDPTRSHISARGYLPPEQFEQARSLIRDDSSRPRRLIVACHYPVAAPAIYERELALKRLKNEQSVREWLSNVGKHIYCCGHVHAAWAFRPVGLPDQLCLNAGAPLMRDPTGFRLPGFLQIELEGDGIEVIHHAWEGAGWMTVPLFENPRFFGAAEAVDTTARDTAHRIY